jgi:hypothetical protein
MDIRSYSRLPMYADHRKGSHDQRAIEFLAEESQVPVNEVAQLYERALAELGVGARIRSFLGIFAIRNVRKILSQRSPRKRTAV